MALMGTGIGRGEHRAVDAAQKAIASPLLEETSIQGARGVLINITGGSDLTLHEVNEAASTVAEAAEGDANIIVGAVVDEALGDEIRVTVIATGFDDARGASPSPLASAAGAAAGGGAPARGRTGGPQEHTGAATGRRRGGGRASTGCARTGSTRWAATTWTSRRSSGARPTDGGARRSPPPAALEAAAAPASVESIDARGELAWDAAHARRAPGALGGRRDARLHDAPPGELRCGLGAAGPFGDRRWPALEPSASTARASGTRGRSTATPASTPMRPTPGDWSARATPCSPASGRGRWPCSPPTACPRSSPIPSGAALAVAHAGWRGTVRGIAGRLVAALVERGGRPPGSAPRRDRAVHRPVLLRGGRAGGGTACGRPSRRPGSAGCARGARPPRSLVAGPVGGQRRAAGGGRRSRRTRSRDPRLCTGCRRDLFFSYRKEGMAGRLATLAVLD